VVGLLLILKVGIASVATLSAEGSAVTLMKRRLELHRQKHRYKKTKSIEAWISEANSGSFTFSRGVSNSTWTRQAIPVNTRKK